MAARKFSNLMPFGCWWFLNNPSIVSEITRERFELLGQSFIPQHSDARVLEQLIYKWKHARRQIVDALSISYEQLLQNGRAVTREEISRDVNRLFSGNFNEWITHSLRKKPTVAFSICVARRVRLVAGRAYELSGESSGLQESSSAG